MMHRKAYARSVRESTGCRLFVLTTLLLFTVLGLCLRIIYARSSSPYIDEYTTMWVGQRTLQHGYPVFPTGALYAQGLLFTYLDAAFFYLFGFSEWIARVPSLILSAGYIPLSYWVGKRIFSNREGLLTCALVALDPQSIGWGGRARSYSLLVFLVLLVVYFLYLGVVRQDRAGYRRLALLVFLGAVFAHNEAILMYPAMLAVALLWRGWRWFLRWDVLAENVLTVGGMGLSFYLYRLMQPTGWSEVGEGRGEVALSLDVARAWDRLKQFFLGPDQLSFVWFLTFLLLVGLAYLLVLCWRKGLRALLNPKQRVTGLLFLYVLFVVVVLEMFFFVSERRLGARYLFMLGPVFFLIASAVLVRLVDLLGEFLRKHRPVVFPARHPILARCVLTAVVLMVITICSLPASIAAAYRQELQYDVAFQYVREHMRDADKVMTFATSPCVLYLGRCDYVAVEKEFHAYATRRGDHWVEAWAGAPILFTDDALERAIREADRMWFVIDQMRFRTRYSTRFIQYVWDHMALAAREDGVFVFRAQNPPPLPPVLQRSDYFNLGDEVGLRGYALSGDDFKPGDRIRLLLRWEGLTHILKNYSVFVHLVDASNFMWAQNDGVALGGLYPTTYWVEGEVISDMREVSLPVDIPSGRYRLEVGMYNPESLERLDVMDESGNYLGDSIILDYVQVSEKPHQDVSPQHLVDASLGDKVTLWGYDVDTTAARPGETVRLVLYWRAKKQVEEDYTVFVHLVDDTGRIWGQEDSQPENGFYPTSYWDIGEVVRDEYEIMVDPDAPPGLYEIEVGMYLLGTGERLPYIDEDGQVLGDVMVLENIQVNK